MAEHSQQALRKAAGAAGRSCLHWFGWGLIAAVAALTVGDVILQNIQAMWPSTLVEAVLVAGVCTGPSVAAWHLLRAAGLWFASGLAVDLSQPALEAQVRDRLEWPVSLPNAELAALRELTRECLFANG